MQSALLLQSLVTDEFWTALASVRSWPAAAAIGVAVIVTAVWRVKVAQYKTVAKAIEKGDEQAVKQVVGDVEVDTKNLTRQQRFELAQQKLGRYERMLARASIVIISLAAMTLLGWIARLYFDTRAHPEPQALLSCTLGDGVDVSSEPLRSVCGVATPVWTHARSWTMRLSSASQSLADPLGELVVRLPDDGSGSHGVALLSQEQMCASNASPNKQPTRDALELHSECFPGDGTGRRTLQLQLMVCGGHPVTDADLTRLRFVQDRSNIESHAIRCDQT